MPVVLDVTVLFIFKKTPVRPKSENDSLSVIFQEKKNGIL